MPARKKRASSSSVPKLMDVTPDLAAKWLDGNVHNRDLSQSVIDRYARDMKAKKWYVSHQGIAFNSEGTLIDGQHRLWAVVESGMTVPMLVVKDLPLKSQLVIDDHYPRRAADFLTLTDKFGHVSKLAAAVLTRLQLGNRSYHKRQTHVEIAESFTKHKDAVEFALSCFPKRKVRITSAPVMGVVARAFYSPFSNDDVKRFCEILLEGKAGRSKKDQTVLSLRDQLLVGANGRPLPPDVAYGKTQAALIAFLEGRSLSKVAMRDGNLFRLPGENDRTIFEIAENKVRRAKDFLKRNGKADTVKLARALKLHPQAARRVLEVCVQHGWATKTPGTGNKPSMYKLRKQRAT